MYAGSSRPPTPSCSPEPTRDDAGPGNNAFETAVGSDVTVSDMVESAPGAEPRPGSGLRMSWSAVFGLVVAAALVYAAIRSTGGLGDAWSQLRHSDGVWLVPALVAIVVRYVLLGMQIRRFSGGEVSTPLGIGVALTTYGLGAVLPAAPAEGMALSIVELRRRSVEVRRSGLMLLASQWVQFWMLITVFAVDRVAAALLGELHRHQRVRAVVGSVVILGVVGLFVWLARRPRVATGIAVLSRWLPGQRLKSRDELAADGLRWQRDLLDAMGSPGNRAAIAVLTAGMWLADAAAFWFALRTVHVSLPFGIAVIGYCVAVFVSWVPFLPSGLGLVEIAVPTVLHHFGVSLDSGLAAIIMWRAVSLFLPALVGLGTYGILRATGRHPFAGPDQAPDRDVATVG